MDIDHGSGELGRRSAMPQASMGQTLRLCLVGHSHAAREALFITRGAIRPGAADVPTAETRRPSSQEARRCPSTPPDSGEPARTRGARVNVAHDTARERCGLMTDGIKDFEVALPPSVWVVQAVDRSDIA
jgi:hypothetical protein